MQRFVTACLLIVVHALSAPANGQLLDLGLCMQANPPAFCKLAPWEKDLDNEALRRQSTAEIEQLRPVEIEAFARALAGCQAANSIENDVVQASCIAAGEYFEMVKETVPSPLSRVFAAVRIHWRASYMQRAAKLQQSQEQVGRSFTVNGLREEWYAAIRRRMAELDKDNGWRSK
jgi:hypothetical protein